MDLTGDGNWSTLDTAKAAVALRWWMNAGVTIASSEAPRNRFKEGLPSPVERPEKAAGNPVAQPAVARSAPPGSERVTQRGPDGAARAIASSSPDLAALKDNLEQFNGCALKTTASQLVFSDGAPGSRVMLVGEAPGGDEDRVGRPFVGRAGQLLDRMLNAIGLDRDNVYIANVVPWRPPGNRPPTLQETQSCLPFIRRQIELAAPEILVCLGASATQTLLGTREGITRSRGNWFTYVCDNGRSIQTIAMLHPAYLLRQPGQKRKAWSDLRALAAALRP